MTHPDSPTAIGDDRDARLHQRRLDALVEVGPGPLLAIVATSIFMLGVALWADGPSLGLGLWVVGLLGQAAYFEWLRRSYEGDPHRRPPDQWEALFTLGALWVVTLISAWYWAFMPWDEPIAVTMVIGNSPQISASLFAPQYTMAAVLANEFAEASGDLYLHALVEIGLVLFTITLIINVISRLFIWSMGAGRPRLFRQPARKAAA